MIWLIVGLALAAFIAGLLIGGIGMLLYIGSGFTF